MKRVYLITLILFGPTSFLRAQQADTAVFTLDKALQYALENSNTIKNATLDEKIANAKVKETRGIGLPQIDGSVQLVHNSKLPRFFSSYDTSSIFFQGAEIDGAQTGDVVAAQNFFQLKNSGDASLSVSQIIFNSSYLVGLQAANAYRELSVKTSQQSREEVVSQVTKAFYTALINQERMKLFETNIARIDSLLRTTSALFKNGFAENIDVSRIRVSLNNIKAERDKFVNLQELSLELLKFQINYPMDRPIKIEGDISSIAVDTNPDSYRESFSYSQRTDYSILETQRRLQELNIKNKYSTSLPSLVAFANLGYSTQSGTFGGLFKTETNISDNGYVGPDKWYPYMLVGVKLNVPIFSGLQRHYQIQQAKLDMMKIENGFSSLKSGIDLEIRNASISYKNALKSLEAQKENMDLASDIARVTKIKYEQGVGSNLEVVDAESSLKEAQINYYDALYAALIAKVDLDKAYGKLNVSEIEEAK